MLQRRRDLGLVKFLVSFVKPILPQTLHCAGRILAKALNLALQGTVASLFPLPLLVFSCCMGARPPKADLLGTGFSWRNCPEALPVLTAVSELGSSFLLVSMRVCLFFYSGSIAHA